MKRDDVLLMAYVGGALTSSRRSGGEAARSNVSSPFSVY